MRGRLYSCDDHLDLNAVPPTLFTDRVPRRLREDVPHVVERDGRRVWISDGRVASTSGASHPSLTALSRLHLEEDAFRPSRPKARLEDMERDNIHASVVYGPFSLAAPNTSCGSLKTRR